MNYGIKDHRFDAQEQGCTHCEECGKPGCHGECIEDQSLMEPSHSTDWEDDHRTLGCYDCRFADEDALGRRPCCTYCGRIQTLPDGRGVTRQKKSHEMHHIEFTSFPYGKLCSVSRCQEEVAFEVTSTRRGPNGPAAYKRLLCRTHAIAFVKRHKVLDSPEVLVRDLYLQSRLAGGQIDGDGAVAIARWMREASEHGDRAVATAVRLYGISRLGDIWEDVHEENESSEALGACQGGCHA